MDDFCSPNIYYKNSYYFYKGGVSWRLLQLLQEVVPSFVELCGRDRSSMDDESSKPNIQLGVI